MTRIFLIAAVFQVGQVNAENLNQWLTQQIIADEKLLSDAISGTDGHSIELLQDSKYYVPFFLELPRGFSFDSPEQKSSFEGFISKKSGQSLAGGYIYRITFRNAPPLYNTSAGDWSNSSWRSIVMEKSLTIEAYRVWEGNGVDFLYATLISGFPPSLFIYDNKGDLKEKAVFDSLAADLEQQLETTVTRYSETGKPVIEMISFAEYLENTDAEWRSVDIAGNYNLRNQEQRLEEQERLQLFEPLTRNAAIEVLQPGAPRTTISSAKSTAAVPYRTSGESEVSAEKTRLPSSKVSSLRWMWIGLAIALVLLGRVLFKRRT